MSLVYRRQDYRSKSSFKLFTDADWANNTEDRKSISGALIMIFGCPVFWSCKRQTVVAKSSTVAEYIACAMGVEEALWIQLFMKTIAGIQVKPFPVMIDNKSTIYRLENSKSSEAQKTVDVMFHSIKDAIQKQVVKLNYCPTGSMLADTVRFKEIRLEMGLQPLGLVTELRGGVVDDDQLQCSTQCQDLLPVQEQAVHQ